MDKKVKQFLAILLVLAMTLARVQWTEKGAEAAVNSVGQQQGTAAIHADIAMSADDCCWLGLKKQSLCAILCNCAGLCF